MEIAKLKTTRRTIKANLTRITNFMNTFNGNDIKVFKTRTRQLEGLLDKFTEAQIEINAIEHPDDEDDDDQEISEFEKHYFTAMDKYGEILDHLQPQQIDNNAQSIDPPANGTNVDQLLRLPIMKIPEFSGKYEDWLSFSEIYRSLIHDSTKIATIQKFHYLISALKGEPADLIKSLEITEVNYEKAWTSLKERYENKRIIINKHMNELFGLKSLTKESASELRKLYSSASQHINALTSLGRPTNYWDDVLVHLITSKLDAESRKEWETSQKTSDPAKYEDLEKFLNQRCQLLETIAAQNPVNEKRSSKQTLSITTTDTNQKQCLLCKESHYTSQCSEFKNFTVDQRIEKMRTIGCCMNCLKKGHKTVTCKSLTNCKICNKRHHTLLHIHQETKEDNNQSATNVNQQNRTQMPQINLCYQPANVLLGTAIVNIEDVWKNNHNVCSILDSGSQINLITSNMAEKLALRQIPLRTPIIGIGDNETMSDHCVISTISSLYSDYQAELIFVVIPNNSKQIPCSKFCKTTLAIPNNISLADPNFDMPRDVDILISAEIFFKTLCVGQIDLGKNCPILQKTKFGWIVAGGASNDLVQSSQCNLTNVQLHNSIQRLWITEEIADTKTMTLEEKRCEEEFLSQTRRNSSGLFVLSLLRIAKPSPLGESFQTAPQRLHSIQKTNSQKTSHSRTTISSLCESTPNLIT